MVRKQRTKQEVNQMLGEALVAYARQAEAPQKEEVSEKRMQSAFNLVLRSVKSLDELEKKEKREIAVVESKRDTWAERVVNQERAEKEAEFAKTRQGLLNQLISESGYIVRNFDRMDSLKPFDITRGDFMSVLDLVVNYGSYLPADMLQSIPNRFANEPQALEVLASVYEKSKLPTDGIRSVFDARQAKLARVQTIYEQANAADYSGVWVSPSVYDLQAVYNIAKERGYELERHPLVDELQQLRNENPDSWDMIRAAIENIEAADEAGEVEAAEGIYNEAVNMVNLAKSRKNSNNS